MTYTNNEPLTKVFAKAWRTEDQSAENPYCTASGRTEFYSTCGVNLYFLIIYSASVPGWTNNNTKPSQSPGRWLQAWRTSLSGQRQLINSL